MIKKIIIVSLLLMYMAGMTYAQDKEKCYYVYEVSYSNCDKITIGNVKAERGVKFDHLNQIHWAKGIENQCLKVWNCMKERYERLLFNCKENRVCLLTDSETNIKGWLDDDTSVTFDTLFYLLDTLKIPTFGEGPIKVDNKVVIRIGLEKIEAKISKSKDGTAFIIPRTLLGKDDKQSFYIDILEKDIEKDWEYYVWRKLYVKLLPLKID